MNQPATLRCLAASSLTAFCLAACVLASAPAVAADTTADRAEEARVEKLWSRVWREFAVAYIKHEDQYVYVKGYDRSIPSSTGVTLRDYKEESALEQTYNDERGKEQTRTVNKPDEECHAAVATLPKVAVGSYGYIHSVDIKDIIDGKTLAARNVWLVDAAAARDQKKELKDKLRQQFAEDIEDAILDRGRKERRSKGEGILSRRAMENETIDWAFEDRDAAISLQRDDAYNDHKWTITGYRTDRLKEDARWPTGKAAEKGLQLIVVKVEGDEVTAVPAAALGRGISEADFLELISRQAITKARFVEIVTEAKRESRTDYDQLVFAKIQGEDVEPGEKEAGGNDTVELAD